MRRIPSYLLLLGFALLLPGCDLLKSEDPAKAAAREAEGKAVGGACRQSGRALEDCYVMYPRSQKAAVYAGWRDMDSYMRENSIPTVVPDLVDPPSGSRAQVDNAPKATDSTGSGAAATEKAKKKTATKRGTVFQAGTAVPKRQFM